MSCIHVILGVLVFPVTMRVFIANSFVGRMATNRSITLLLIVLAGSLAGFASSLPAAPVTVAVAANMQFTFDELRRAYTDEHAGTVDGIFSSSGALTAQIENGAPFQIFLSADTEYPTQLQKDGFAAITPRIYAYGALVLWTRRDLDLSDWRTLLRNANTKRIALANPKTAPYGREAINVLNYFKLYDAVANKLVFGASISQTNQYIESGSVDIGITAKSVVLSPQLAGKGAWIALPSESYTPIAQAAVLIQRGELSVSKDAQQFYDFLFGATARDILHRAGYGLP